MMKRLLLLSTLAVSMSAFAADPKAPSMSKDEQAIRKLEGEWDANHVKPDKAWFEKVMSDDFTNTHWDGKVFNKQQEIADILDTKATQTLMNSSATDATIAAAHGGTEGMRVRVYGNTAVVTGTAESKGTEDGKEFSRRERFIDVWVKQAGQWKIVSTHSTAL